MMFSGLASFPQLNQIAQEITGRLDKIIELLTEIGRKLEDAKDDLH